MHAAGVVPQFGPHGSNFGIPQHHVDHSTYAYATSPSAMQYPHQHQPQHPGHAAMLPGNPHLQSYNPAAAAAAAAALSPQYLQAMAQAMAAQSAYAAQAQAAAAAQLQHQQQQQQQQQYQQNAMSHPGSGFSPQLLNSAAMNPTMMNIALMAALQARMNAGASGQAPTNQTL